MQLRNAYLVVERAQEGADHIQRDKVLYELGMGCCKGAANAPAHRVPDEAKSVQVEVFHGASDVHHVVHEVVPNAWVTNGEIWEI